MLSRDQYAAIDVGSILGTAASRSESASVGGGSGSGSRGGGTGTGSGNDSPSVGTGPGGQKLYAAEWYREPTHAEMVTYMPRNVAQGWGVIACRTVERYHVDDCVVLGESPGSGIARGMRQAAWQFLVRPPRIDGKSQVGTWVRIRFDIDPKAAADQ